MRNAFIVQLFLTTIPPVQHPVSKVVAAPGSDVTLGCPFSYSEADNILNLVVNWQRGDTEVVHSYYQGKDQLEKQSAAYSGRTKLYPDQLTEGSASLTLMGLLASDHGEYTCIAANEQGTSKGRHLLLVAVHQDRAASAWIEAPYDEPQFEVQTTCGSMVLSYTFMQGFPQPVLLWRNKAGSDITNQSHTRADLDSKGRYVVQSKMELKATETQTITIEMSLGMLNQSFSRSITLHPLPECCENPAGPRNHYMILSVRRESAGATQRTVVLVLLREDTMTTGPQTLSNGEEGFSLTTAH
ncbi:hypothetical protein AAFF_G00204860 [Aldrovandia affinis]|uniref:Ig-like domain-containing protein n=1 Tax=Aldrovandia affinis TaxID=143900 RepID=A0AAD7W5R8_9TELE|nr:hypothetical protein AAFF_G00204860 [Aldrovandia affinis]